MNINLNKTNNKIKSIEVNKIPKNKTKTKSNNNLKNTLKEIRKENGLTQEELAHMVGVSRQTINAIENSRMSPTLILAFRITRALQQEKIEDIFTYIP